MVHDYLVDKVLDEIKMIKDIETFDNTEILIETGDKFEDDIALKSVLVLILCVIKDNDKFYPQLFLEKKLVLW